MLKHPVTDPRSSLAKLIHPLERVWNNPSRYKRSVSRLPPPAFCPSAIPRSCRAQQSNLSLGSDATVLVCETGPTGVALFIGLTGSIETCLGRNIRYICRRSSIMFVWLWR